MTQIRIDKLQKIVDSKFGSWNKLAQAIEKEASYLNGVKNGKRPFTEKLARDIEEKLGLPPNYLDKADTDLEDTTFQVAEYYVKLAANSQCGAEVIDPNNIKRHWTLDKSFLTEFHVKPENLAIVEIFGDSMLPTVRSGERVVIDKSQREEIDNRVFAITTRNQCWVKRLRLTPKGKMWESDNEEYRQYDKDINDGTPVRIEGIVLYSLGRKIS